jgi:hypothetical protein
MKLEIVSASGSEFYIASDFKSFPYQIRSIWAVKGLQPSKIDLVVEITNSIDFKYFKTNPPVEG